ncbi:MAG TPA: hypothetical protein VIG50_03410 [Vicinamibacteria bacterium]|jgi:hypothetical protein
MTALAVLALLAAAAPETRAREDAVAAARALVAKERGVAVADVHLRRATATEWPDARLGCPGEKPAEAAPVAGYRVLLESGGKTYAVHTGDGRAVRCKPERRGPPLPHKKTQG